MATVKVGIIGAGFIGGFHARAVRGLIKMGLVDAEYVAVCDSDSNRAETFARLGALRFWTTDPDELIDSPEVTAIYVCTPTRHHRDLVLKVAASGKAVFCEKPLATNLEDARHMHDAVVAARVPHQVGLILRHSPVFTVMRDLMSDEALGRPMVVLFRDDQFFPIQGHYNSAWRKEFDVTGGGTLIEHSVHDLDLLRWLLGEVASVQAETRNFAGYPGVEDLATVRLCFASDCRAFLVSVWHNVLTRRSSRLMEAFFENGYFSCDRDMFGDLQFDTCAAGPGLISRDEVNARYLELVGLQAETRLRALEKYSLEDYFFLRDVAEGRKPWPGFEVGLHAHELVDAVYRSAAEGREVDLRERT